MTLSIGVVAAIVGAAGGAAGLVLAGVYFLLGRTERTIGKRVDDAERNMNRRFDDAQRANDQAHAAITENILRVERQQEKSLDRLYGLIANVFPRAAAENPEANR